jgi:hypothetical protein
MSSTRLTDSLYYRISRKTGRGILIFWSREWLSRRPWTYDGAKVNYFYDKHVTEKEQKVMTSTFIGPLLIVRIRRV